jgi:hypothetical protein
LVSLTGTDLRRLLPNADRMVTGWLWGTDLLGLAARLDASHAVVGLERVGDAFRSNDRRVELDRLYRLVTSERLVGEQGELIPVGQLLRVAFATTTEGDGTAADLVVAQLREGRFVGRDGDLAGSGPYLDLGRRLQWTPYGSASVYLMFSKVDSPRTGWGTPRYRHAELGNWPVGDMSLSGWGGVRGESRDHGILADLRLGYGLSWTPGLESSAVQYADEIGVSGSYEFRAIRGKLGGVGYAPIPFVGAELLSEFDRPADLRSWHRLQPTGLVGVRFRPIDALAVQAAFHVRRELLDPKGRTLAGLNLGYSLERGQLFEILGNAVEIESATDWFISGPGEVQEIRHWTHLYFEIVSAVFFDASFDLYAYRTAEVGQWGTHVGFTGGLNVLVDGRFLRP